MVRRTNMNENDGSSSSSSSRKAKKNGPDKPKQRQRGLGVAQLEGIRLNRGRGRAHFPSDGPNNPHETPMMLDVPRSPSPPSFNGFRGHMTGLPDLNVTYAEPQVSDISRSMFYQGNSGFGSTQQNIVEPSLNMGSFSYLGLLNDENMIEMDFMGLSTRNSGSQDARGSGSRGALNSASQEVDLELRLYPKP